MACNFDLNLLAQNEEIEVLFNSNEIPPTEESFNNGDGDCSIDQVQNEETGVLLDLNEVPPSEESFNNGHGDCSIDPYHEDTIQDAQNPARTCKYLSDDERHEIFCALLAKSIGGKLGKNVTREISHQFSVPIFTVQRIWKRAKETASGERVYVSSRKTGNCGRKRISLQPNQVAAVPLHKRATLRSMSMAMNVSCTTLFRRKKEGFIRRHTNSIKPHLKEDNMKGRLQFCISMLDESTLPYEPKFVDMYNIVHIDEKWFYMTRKSEKYYLLPAEDEPLRPCQSKNYIGKVMFLAAMACRRFDEEGKEVFSGKIGVFPFVTMEPAKRRSKNRDAVIFNGFNLWTYLYYYGTIDFYFIFSFKLC